MNDLPTALEQRPTVKTLAALNREEAGCRRCELYKDATQVVPGEGASRAVLMLVGEQPGDREDLAGKPFVGPAGRILDRALAEAGVPRDKTYVTNAVKHFKYEWRGKRRLHKRPDAGEIEACRWWLDMERSLVRPAAILGMGATAARSLLGHPTPIAANRGRPLTVIDGAQILVTIHPSLLLRLRDEADKQREYRQFVEDLQLAAKVSGLAA
jgi:uracil-DNA glycosylase family protein